MSWGPTHEPGKEFSHITQAFLNMPLNKDTLSEIAKKLNSMENTSSNDRCMRASDENERLLRDKTRQELRECFQYGCSILDKAKIMAFMMGSHPRLGVNTDIKQLHCECLYEIFNKFDAVN
jgi:hypothetical protein